MAVLQAPTRLEFRRRFRLLYGVALLSTLAYLVHVFSSWSGYTSLFASFRTPSIGTSARRSWLDPATSMSTVHQRQHFKTAAVRENTDTLLYTYQAFLDNLTHAHVFAGDLSFDHHPQSGAIFCTPSLALGEISVYLDGIPAEQYEQLSASRGHQLNIVSRCDGLLPGVSDFYETLISNEHYRGRITLNPPYDGSGISIGDIFHLPDDLIGQSVRVRVWRLYREFEGLKVNVDLEGNFNRPGPYARESVLDRWIEVVAPASTVRSDNLASSARKPQQQWLPRWSAPRLTRREHFPGPHRQCLHEDFKRADWKGGYWYRHGKTDDAWHFYLPHCRTRKFTQAEASECLNGRFIGFIGDSTSQDMMRNTLWTFLGNEYPYASDAPLPKNVLRDSDFNLTHPNHPERWTRMAMMFNGHHELRENKIGIHSLRHSRSQERHRQFFGKARGMDAILVNSGIHDAYFRPSLRGFLDDFDFGWKYYEEHFKKIGELNNGSAPEIVYRFSLTPAVDLDRYRLVVPANPWSIAAINLLQKEYLNMRPARVNGTPLTYLDSYEITWGWHFDKEMNDGLYHYGRPPWDTPGVKKMVDDMTVHIFLNRLCPAIGKRG